MKNFTNILNKSISLAGTKTAQKLLYFLSFLESVIFPLPIDPLLCACVVAKPKKVLQLATLTLFFSVAGGVLGWLIGFF